MVTLKQKPLARSFTSRVKLAVASALVGTAAASAGIAHADQLDDVM